MNEVVQLSFDEMWERIIACDEMYDGLFFTAVKTTKIYCRPSCKSRQPKKQNVEFYHDIDEVESAGYRACKRCQPKSDHSPNRGLIRNVTSFLVSNYRRKISLQEIADHVGVSPFYLERLFKKETNETPRSYLDKIRIDKAVHLLTTSRMTNLEICFEIGYSSSSNFYKVFRNHKGCSPNEFRQNLKERQS